MTLQRPLFRQEGYEQSMPNQVALQKKSSQIRVTKKTKLILQFPVATPLLTPFIPLGSDPIPAMMAASSSSEDPMMSTDCEWDFHLPRRLRVL